MINGTRIHLGLNSHLLRKVRVTSISDAHAADAEELTTGSSQINVVTSEVVNGSAGEHGVVFDFRAAERGAVGRDNDQLGYKEKD